MDDKKFKIIKKKEILKLLESIAEEYNIFVPTKENDDARFLRFKPGQDIYWDYRNTKILPKEILFPQAETLFSYGDGTKIKTGEPAAGEKGYLIFGIRPCDARAISLLDKVFGGEDFKDPYYLERRKNTTVITLACNKPQIECFCTSMGGSPCDEKGSDIILFDTGEDILAKAVTGKGEKFIEKLSKWFKEAGKPDIAKKDKLIESSLKKIRSQVDVENLKERLDGAFDASFWNEVHQKCLGCGICTYLCPTCHCFEITDEMDPWTADSKTPSGKRVRCWDSCMYPLFTLHASGHNPRPTYKERMRQRIMHKFNYCPENYNEIFCVGCGRCVRNCPVNIDIREMLTYIGSAE
jgi:ferredoxin